MSEFILKMDKWDRVENSYIYPRTPNKRYSRPLCSE